MRIHICLFFYQFIIIYRDNSIDVKALIGPNVRSAELNEFPFIVAIVKYYVDLGIPHNLRCTGTLISKSDVLTSEHCLSGERLTGLEIIIGSAALTRGTVYYAEWWISFDQWTVFNNRTIEQTVNDIAMLNLLERVPDRLQIAELFDREMCYLYGIHVEIAGWGFMINDSVPIVLQTGTVTVLEKSDCERKASRLLGQRVTIDAKTICTKGVPYVAMRDGDSGGPLFLTNLLIGINFGTAPVTMNDTDPRKINLHIFARYYNNFILDLRDYF